MQSDTGWSDRCNVKNGLKLKGVSSESRTVICDMKLDWLISTLPGRHHLITFLTLMELLPEKTLAFNNKHCMNRRESKDHINVMIASGFTHHVGGVNVKILLMEYTGNKACMKENTCINWLRHQIGTFYDNRANLLR